MYGLQIMSEISKGTQISNPYTQNIYLADFIFVYDLQHLWILTSKALVRRATERLFGLF